MSELFLELLNGNRDLFRYLHPCQVHIWQNITEISDDYKFIVKAVESYQEASKNSHKKSLYKTAFYEGIRSILDDYNVVLTRVENALKSEGGSSPLSEISVECEMLVFSVPLRIIRNTLTDMEDSKINGCQIVEMCYNYTVSGIPSLMNSFKKILKPCRVVLLKQIKSWILYGTLNDPSEEFFIQQISVDEVFDDSSTVSLSSTSSSHSSQDSSIVKYQLAVEYLPQLIRLSTATKILFVGTTIQLFFNNSSDFNKGSAPVIDISKYGVDQSYVADKFEELENAEEFDIGLLEVVINDLWLCINKHLRILAEDVGSFSSQLKFLTDIYLLGRGELFQEFLLRADVYLSISVKLTKCSYLDRELERAARNVYLSENTDILDRVYFFLPPKGSYEEGAITRDVVRLNYKAPWPLNLIFTFEVISRYNQIFKFLLRLKKATIDVASAWKEYSNPLARPQNIVLAQNQLLCLLKNLENYLFVDVIRGELEVLENIVTQSDSFFEIQKAHDMFLNNVLTQAFLLGEEVYHLGNIENVSEGIRKNSHSVSLPLLGLFSVCGKFRRVIKSAVSSELVLIAEEIKSNINVLIEHFIHLANSNFETVISNNICNLILRLDYNEYFRKNASFKSSN